MISEMARRAGLMSEKIRQKVFPTARERLVHQFYSDGGEKVLRYQYDLAPDSIVLDLGGYVGDWADQINTRYDCIVHVFEPVPGFAALCRKRFLARPKVVVHEFGLGKDSHTEVIVLSENASSSISLRSKTDDDTVNARIDDIVDWLSSEAIAKIDLIKINIEGGEFDLLDRMIEADIVTKCRDIQVQFHDFYPDAASRMAAIQSRLAETHRTTYQYPFVWENWRRVA